MLNTELSKAQVFVDLSITLLHNNKLLDARFNGNA